MVRGPLLIRSSVRPAFLPSSVGADGLPPENTVEAEGPLFTAQFAVRTDIGFSVSAAVQVLDMDCPGRSLSRSVTVAYSYTA